MLEATDSFLPCSSRINSQLIFFAEKVSPLLLGLPTANLSPRPCKGTHPDEI